MMRKLHQDRKRAGEKQPDPFAKRRRTEHPRVRLLAISAATTTHTAEGRDVSSEAEDPNHSTADESVESSSDDDPSSVSEDAGSDLLELLYSGHNVNDSTHRDCNLACYGMVSKLHMFSNTITHVTDVLTQLGDVQCQVLRGRLSRYLQGNDGDHVELSLHVDQSLITVGISDDEAFAQLNRAASTALHKIAALPRMKFHAYMARDSLEGLISKYNDLGLGTTPIRFKLSINVSGPSSDGKLVGEILSDRDLFLQDPLQRGRDPYENPHVWTFEDLPDVDIWLAGLTQGRPTVEQQSWNRVLDELPDFDTGHSDLDVSHLATPLLK